MAKPKQIEVASQRLQGLGVSPGHAIGSVCLFAEGRHNNMPIFKIETEEDRKQEMKRFLEAKEAAQEEIERLQKEVEMKVGKNEAAIFHAHRVILTDEAIDEKIEECLKQTKMNIEYCVVEVFNEYEEMIASMDNEYMKERGTDFAEIKRRLLDKLGNMNPQLACQGEQYCTRGKGRVIVAQELTPSLTVEIDCDEVIGFVTAHGGKTSHAAILANALGVPAVTGIPALSGLPCGTIVYLNGDTGEVWINPPDEEMPKLEERHDTEAEEEEIDIELGVKLLANVNDARGARLAYLKKAQGCGLVRTEYLFMESAQLPSEDEQFVFYGDIVKESQGRTVTFRLLDVGGDKPVSYLHIGNEDNPYLGWRGTRFLLDNPQIVQGQVRAIARARELGPVEIMYPMISDVRQLRAIKEVVRDAFPDTVWDAMGIREGAMIEVPSIIFQIDEIVDEVDFLSIGTNDLIQYTFAVDRNNENVAEDYDPTHPVLWEIIKKAAAAAQAKGKPVSVCGEMAGMPAFTEDFVKAGVTSLSMSPRMIPRLRKRLAQIVRARQAEEAQTSE